jgi:hypothetical protein
MHKNNNKPDIDNSDAIRTKTIQIYVRLFMFIFSPPNVRIVPRGKTNVLTKQRFFNHGDKTL